MSAVAMHIKYSAVCKTCNESVELDGVVGAYEWAKEHIEKFDEQKNCNPNLGHVVSITEFRLCRFEW